MQQTTIQTDEPSDTNRQTERLTACRAINIRAAIRLV